MLPVVVATSGLKLTSAYTDNDCNRKLKPFLAHVQLCLVGFGLFPQLQHSGNWRNSSKPTNNTCTHTIQYSKRLHLYAHSEGKPCTLLLYTVKSYGFVGATWLVLLRGGLTFVIFISFWTFTPGFIACRNASCLAPFSTCEHPRFFKTTSSRRKEHLARV